MLPTNWLIREVRRTDIMQVASAAAGAIDLIDNQTTNWQIPGHFSYWVDWVHVLRPRIKEASDDLC